MRVISIFFLCFIATSTFGQQQKVSVAAKADTSMQLKTQKVDSIKTNTHKREIWNFFLYSKAEKKETIAWDSIKKKRIKAIRKENKKKTQ